MDLQNNITFIIKNNEFLQRFSFSVKDNLSKNILFTLNEYQTAFVENNCNDYDVFVEDIISGEEICLRLNENICINNFDHPNPPMDYRIRLVNKKTKKIKLFLYKIKPKQMSSENYYKNMIATIAKYDEKLLYEEDVKFLHGKRIFNNIFKSLYTVFSNINFNKNRILFSLNRIKNNPESSETKMIERTSVVGKQSVRSINKNYRRPNNDVVFSSVLKIDYNTKLNQYLIFILNFSIQSLTNLMKQAKIEIINNKKKKEKILNFCSNFVSKRQDHTNFQLEQIDRKINICEAFLKSSKSIIGAIKNLLVDQKFQSIKPSVVKAEKLKFQKDYLNLELSLYKTLFQGYTCSIANDYHTILSNPIKQTSKLFEIYSLYAIETSLLELGFIEVSYDVLEEKIIKRFTKDNYLIEINYSCEAIDVSEAVSGNIFYLSKSVGHISPDFALVLFKDSEPISFMLFDSKCRRTEYLFNDIAKGNYEKTIRDYLSLKYASSERVIKNSKAVTSLWFLLPEDNNETIYKPINNLEYEFIKLKIDGIEDDFVIKFTNYLVDEMSK